MKKLLLMGLLLSGVFVRASHKQVKKGEHYTVLFDDNNQINGYACRECTNIFLKEDSKDRRALDKMKKHVLAAHIKSEVKCPHPGCSKSFFSQHNLSNHIIHHRKALEKAQYEKEKADDPFAEK